MQLSSYIAQITGKTQDELFSIVNPLVVIERDIDGNFSITKWDKSLSVKEPSAADLAAALKAPEPTVSPDISSISDRQFRLWVLAKMGVDQSKAAEEASKL
ncbi:hypothetical protein A6U86_05390 [Rhizobium sp. AC27/96]|uniref:hypothetical protein n=1 Tax=Rhizobium sp. AC27/96 TaxID=1841653 RepID=UPI000828FEAA|nr:hypothetical protein [Rhizobium sp. AC27/96]OCJ12458.1 hypothetical protein A6U86_05390 [Rhizobium sp. AC27/96]